MRGVSIMAGAVALALIGGALALAYGAGLVGGPLTIMGVLLSDASLIGRLVLLLILASAGAILVLGALALMRRTPPSEALVVLTFTPAGLGLAGALEVAFIIHLTVQKIGPVSFLVMAPTIAGAVLLAGLGLLVSAIAAGVRAVTDARGSGLGRA